MNVITSEVAPFQNNVIKGYQIIGIPKKSNEGDGISNIELQFTICILKF